jgi:hypothetical protein
MPVGKRCRLNAKAKRRGAFSSRAATEGVITKSRYGIFWVLWDGRKREEVVPKEYLTIKRGVPA